MTARLLCAGLSDPGRRRENNEDRFHADPDRGIFFVIDGVGGQAAGEKAADTAWQILKDRLERPTGTAAERIREAIALANNEIHRLSHSNDEWHGMACVLTVAVLEDGEITIGQVGDSRLYLIQPGEIRKLTHDHSPVGEREDRGDIDEMTAMRHPRRNEVFRDVGTTVHQPEDSDFVEISTATFPADGLLLLCSDGLTDLVTSRKILAIVEANAGKPDLMAQSLVDAANDAGGKDNITVVIAEGPKYALAIRRRLSSPRTTIPLDRLPGRNPLASRWAFLLYGLLLTAAIIVALRPHWITRDGAEEFGFGAVRQPRIWKVSNDINAAITNAEEGDTVLVAPGVYNEQIRLRSGVSVISEAPRGAVIRANGVAVTGEDVRGATLEGFRIEPDETVYLQIGIQLAESAVEIVDNEITGTVTAGIQLEGSASTVLRANTVEARSRAALVIGGEGEGPRVVGNEFSASGHPAVVVTGQARPTLIGNTIRAAEPVFLPPSMSPAELLRRNFVVSPQTDRRRESKPPSAPNAPSRVR